MTFITPLPDTCKRILQDLGRNDSYAASSAGGGAPSYGGCKKRDERSGLELRIIANSQRTNRNANATPSGRVNLWQRNISVARLRPDGQDLVASGVAKGRVGYISPFRYLARSTLIGIRYTLASRFPIVLIADLAKARFQSSVGLKSEGNMILFVVSQ
jgi:hypothetical protein